MNRRILLIGIGELGCSVAESFARTARPEDGAISILALDTDERTAERSASVPFISLAHRCKICDILNEIDNDLIKNWFPCDRDNDCVEYFETMSMDEGSNQWRMKALLSFYYYLSQPKNYERFSSILEDFISVTDDTQLSELSIDVYPVASLAGGTGSGLVLPLSLYLKRFFAQKGITNVRFEAMLALPDVCGDILTAEQLIKAKANAYACLRELNAINLNAFGKQTELSLRIGDESDPVFGLLYDSKSPESQISENIPFTRICLFKRMPGIKTVTYHVELLADIFRSLCADPIPNVPANESLFCGISLNKSVYPASETVKYISHKTVADIAKDDWLKLFDLSYSAYLRLESNAAVNQKELPSHSSVMASAVFSAFQSLATSDGNGDTVLNRKFNPQNQNRPQITETNPSLYIKELESAVSKLLVTKSTATIFKIIEDNQSSSSADQKSSPFSKGKSQKELYALAKACKSALRDYYNNGLNYSEKITHITDALEDPSSALCIKENLLKENGAYIHPSYALIRLSCLHRELSLSIQDELKHRDDKAYALTPDAIPEWLLTADSSVHMKCKYDTNGPRRLEMLLSGDKKAAGGKPQDRKLFCYDLEIAFRAMERTFRSFFIEAVLQVIEKWIDAYSVLFKGLREALAEHATDTDAALNCGTGRLGTVYHVGASAEEKEHLYGLYRASLTESDGFFTISPELDLKISEAFISLIPEAMTENADTEASLLTVIHSITDIVKAICENSEFYSRYIDKDILQVLLTQDGEHGADSSSLALSKAFCGVCSPIIYELPDTNDSYLISRNIKRSVLALLPESSKQYLISRSDGDDPQKVMESILFEAGEYEANAFFTDSLPKNELRVVRTVSGLKLSLIEDLNENSSDFSYYKAYLKALAQQKLQSTALWDPHCVTSLDKESLALISD